MKTATDEHLETIAHWIKELDSIAETLDNLSTSMDTIAMCMQELANHWLPEKPVAPPLKNR